MYFYTNVVIRISINTIYRIVWKFGKQLQTSLL